MNKTLFSIISFFSLFQLALGQQFNNYNVLSNEKFDSITISTVHYQDKTTDLPLAKDFHPAIKDSITGKWSLPYYEQHNTKDTIFILKRKKLTTDETLSLNKFLKNKSSYVRGVPLPYDYDIQLDYYKIGSLEQTITISSNTKKIIIKKKGCKTYIDKNNQEIDPCFFMGKVSYNFYKYLTALMKRKRIWEKHE